MKLKRYGLMGMVFFYKLNFLSYSSRVELRMKYMEEGPSTQEISFGEV